MNESILRVIREKAYQWYYLGHYFSQREESEKYRSCGYNWDTIHDFLLQNGKWRLEGDDFIFCDQEVINTQNGVLKMVLKQIGSNLMSGKSIMNMSLPVEIFDRKSMLEYLATMMGFTPRFLHEACNTKNLVEQMKYVTTSLYFISSVLPNIEKPFNPILG
ncbi:unnamed protein product [Sphagnum balticum]